MKHSLLILTVFLLISGQMSAQGKLLSIDICEGDIPFSFANGAMHQSYNGDLFIIHFKDTIGDFIAIHVDTEAHIVCVATYLLPAKSKPITRITEQLDTGDRTYRQMNVYDCTRYGTWLYFDRNGKLIKREDY